MFDLTRKKQLLHKFKGRSSPTDPAFQGSVRELDTIRRCRTVYRCKRVMCYRRRALWRSATCATDAHMPLTPVYPLSRVLWILSANFWFHLSLVYLVSFPSSRSASAMVCIVHKEKGVYSAVVQHIIYVMHGVSSTVDRILQ